MDNKKKKIGIIGYGKVGSTLSKIWSGNNLSVNVFDRNIKKQYKDKNINFLLSIAEVLDRSDIVFLSVQERNLKSLINNIKVINKDLVL